MQVTIEFPDQLAEQIRSSGKSVDELVIELLEAKVSSAPTFLKPKLSIEEMFDRLALHSEKIPELPDYAFTRESFYEDHD